MVLRALQTGMSQAAKNRRMLLVFYLANLLFGVILMLPFRGVLSEYIGSSRMGEILGGRLDMDFLFEFIQGNDAVVGIFGSLIPLVPVIAWLVMLFLSGGAFSVLASGQPYSPAAFWGGAAVHFGRFVRLLLWSLPFGLLFFCLQFLVPLVQRIIFGSDPYQNVTYWLGWVTVALRYVSIILFGMLLDYARAHAVITGERKMRRSVWSAFKFMFAHFVRTFSLALALFLVGAVALVIYNPLSNSLAANSVFIILLMFLVQQCYMFFRMFMRLSYYGSHIRLMQDLAPAAAPAAAPARPDDLGVEGAPA